RPDYIAVEPQAGNRVIQAKLNTDGAIRDLFQRAPFGRYRAFFEAWGQSNVKSESGSAIFNYVYIDAFRSRTFNPNENNDFSVAPSGGILIQKHSPRGGYSSADLE